MNALRSRVFNLPVGSLRETVLASINRAVWLDSCAHFNTTSCSFFRYRDGQDFYEEIGGSEQFDRKSSRDRKSERSNSYREQRDNRRLDYGKSFDSNPSLGSDGRKYEPYKVYGYNYFAKGRNENKADIDSEDRRGRSDDGNKRCIDEYSSKIYSDYELKNPYRSGYEDEATVDQRLYDTNGRFNESFGDERDKRRNPNYRGKYQSWKVNHPRYTVKLPGVSNVQLNHGRKQREFVPNPYNITEENRFKILNDVITPLHAYSYDYQMNEVYQKMVILLKKLKNQLAIDGADVMSDDRGLICEVDFTKGSPLIDEYRNKDEFTVWPGFDGNRKTVGFLVGEPKKHTGVVCVEPDELKITKKSHRLLAKLFQTYLREVSPLDACIELGGEGNWRRLIVRSNVKGEHMVIAILHPNGLSDEQIQDEKDRLKNYFEPFADENQIKSLYFQACPGVRCTHEMAPFQLLFGDSIITETLNGLSFQLSPEAFFQVNTSAAVVLYNTILDELNPSKDLTVIDLCCGIGAISLHVAPYVQRVIGIEQSKSAVEDAKKNAERNSVRNCTFINGSVEDILPQLHSALSMKKVVLVANPGRDGLPKHVISKIRAMECIERVVYISCKPQGTAFNNFRFLMTPEFRYNITGRPFLASHAVPVHLFPSTAHSELIIVFDRVLN